MPMKYEALGPIVVFYVVTMYGAGLKPEWGFQA